MSENYTNKLEKKKTPVFLIVLIILSALYILISIFSTGMLMMNGPKSEETFLMQEVEIARATTEMQSAGADANLTEMIGNMSATGLAQEKHVHQNVFWSYHGLLFLASVIGAISLYFMYHLKKLGFHLYIVYTLLTILVSIALIPSEIRLQWAENINIGLSILFVGLYALNLKHFGSPEDEKLGDLNTYDN
jgi:hypothetical protein